jgi:hypothetical protein
MFFRSLLEGQSRPVKLRIPEETNGAAVRLESFQGLLDWMNSG